MNCNQSISFKMYFNEFSFCVFVILAQILLYKEHGAGFIAHFDLGSSIVDVVVMMVEFVPVMRLPNHDLHKTSKDQKQIRPTEQIIKLNVFLHLEMTFT